jgi:pilus assembly protein CpaE
MSDVRACLFGFGPEHESLREAVAAIEWVRLIGSATREDIGCGVQFEIAVVNFDAAGGLETLRALASKQPEAKIIAIGNADPQAIITAMRAGCSQYVPSPVEERELRSAFESARPAQNTVHQTICVVGSSSGAGATTVACNLALELAARAGRCAVIDLDLEFGGVASAFDRDPKYTIADLCREGRADQLDKTVLGEALAEVEGVSLLARPNDIEDANHVEPAAVDKLIGLLGEMFPFVVVDLSRINGELGRAALRRADRVLIVVQLNVVCVRTAERIYHMAVKAGVDPRKIAVVVNRAQSQSSLAAKKMESFLKAPIIAHLPNDYSQVRMSLDMGITENGDNPVRRAARDLAACVTGEKVAEKPRIRLRDRFLKLNFSRAAATASSAPPLRPHVYILYGAAATAAMVAFVMTLPWFTRIVSRLVGGAEL